jgi:hypothetical protein
VTTVRVTCETCGADLGTVRAEYPRAEGGRVVTFEPGPGCDHVAESQLDDERREVYDDPSTLPVVTTRE